MKFYPCYIDVSKVTTQSLYAIFTKQMLQCYSVAAHPLAKNQKKNIYMVLSYFVVL